MTYLQNFIDFDPLKGKPNVKVMVLDIIILGLSEFKSILEIKGLKQIDIFGYYFLSIIVKL
jgi:hypothetical protein